MNATQLLSLAQVFTLLFVVMGPPLKTPLAFYVRMQAFDAATLWHSGWPRRLGGEDGCSSVELKPIRRITRGRFVPSPSTSTSIVSPSSISFALPVHR